MAHTPTTALEVAKYLIELAGSDEESDYISPLRLQKLLYYVQGWHLARYDHPLFQDQIKAWALGPVIVNVWHEFKNYGKSGIPDTDVNSPAHLSEQDKAFIHAVWDVYKSYSAFSLSQMTHQEPPWKEARGTLPPEAASNKVISHKSMKNYFKSIDNS